MKTGSIKKPRLFYWEDTEDCFCAADESHFPGLVSQMLNRGVTEECLSFYYQDTPEKANTLCYDVGQATLYDPESNIENYIDIDMLDEGDDIELMVEIEFMTDAEFSALPEI